MFPSVVDICVAVGIGFGFYGFTVSCGFFCVRVCGVCVCGGRGVWCGFVDVGYWDIREKNYV